MSTEDAGQAKILVVDDTPTNVSVLLEMLGRQGWRVLVARDAASALVTLLDAPVHKHKVYNLGTP